eukprot:2159301-Prymnesium_polylepis.1
MVPWIRPCLLGGEEARPSASGGGGRGGDRGPPYGAATQPVFQGHGRRRSNQTAQNPRSRNSSLYWRHTRLGNERIVTSTNTPRLTSIRCQPQVGEGFRPPGPILGRPPPPRGGDRDGDF